jgi:branched-chain amino acid transport system ATP-binding protein
MLESHGLNVFYAGIQVLWDVNVRVPAGKIVTLIGPNGAGKSTLLKAILGIIPVQSGSLVFDGHPIDRLPPHERVSQGIVYVPEGRRIFPGLSVQDNLELGALSRGARETQAENLRAVFELFPVLGERQKQMAGTLSGGEMQMLALARGLMGHPKLMMVDEPSFGLAPKVVAQIFEMVRSIHSRGVTVLLVEQNVAEALNFADQAYVLENGRIELQGPGRTLLEHEHVRRAYLGL